MVADNFLIGQFNRELLLGSSGVTGVYAVRFHAWGLYPILKQSMHLYTNKLSNLHLLFGEEIHSFKELLLESDQPIKILADFIRSKVSAFSPEGEIVRKITLEIYQESGLVQIGALMDKFELSERSIQRLFLEHVGISAKMLAKIIRFKREKELIERDPDLNFSEVSYASGYSDQSHFIKNFRSLYGITPFQHRARVKELKRHF